MNCSEHKAPGQVTEGSGKLLWPLLSAVAQQAATQDSHYKGWVVASLTTCSSTVLYDQLWNMQWQPLQLSVSLALFSR